MRLGVNVDHVATLRQQRRGQFPDPLFAALTAQAHGADSIVAHLREDRRHIQDEDIHLLRQGLKIPLALEMGATDALLLIALETAPARVCLVPEKRQELTTEGGLDVVGKRNVLKKMIARLSARKIEVSLFVDPDEDQIRCARAVGAQTVELHTGRYAEATGVARANELLHLQRAAALAVKLKLHLHAGHGLDYRNARPVAKIEGMEELNIGFSIVSEALFVGLADAVRQMKNLISH
jgi:pyridoxine 5-phosphate synthase